eukprot:COSAG01_NODE_783_length_13630_cov_5.556459_6_plen_86_part_00
MGRSGSIGTPYPPVAPMQPSPGPPQTLAAVCATVGVSEATHINRSIHSASVVLPPHLQLGRRLVSWRAASRLSSMLITYRFPRDA